MIRWKSAWTMKQVEVTDLIIEILDKDDKIHTMRRKCGWYWDDFETGPKPKDLKMSAEYMLERDEYLITDAGLRIPRCNIKHVEFKDQPKRTVEAEWCHLGVRDWGSFEWIAFTFCSGVITVILGIFGLCIWAKLAGK